MMGINDDAKLRAKELADSLSFVTARRILDELSHLPLDGIDGNRVDPVRSALIERLNNLRPHRARRLFTSLIEPFLYSRAVLLRARTPMPFMFHRAEAGALWGVLARHAFLEAALEAARTLDSLCETRLLDEALQTEQAVEAREGMRVAALDYIVRVMGAPRELEHVLAAVSQIRNRELARHGLEADHMPPPFSVEQLRQYQMLLTAAPFLLDHFRLVLGAFEELDDEAAGRLLAAMEDGLQAELREMALPVEVAVTLPLLVLKQSRTLGPISFYFKEHRPVREAPVMAAGLHALFSGHCRVLAASFRSIFHLEDPIEDFQFDHGQVEALSSDVERLGRVVKSLIMSGLANDSDFGPSLRPVAAGFLRHVRGERVDDGPLFRLNRRIHVAARTCGRPAADHEATVACARYLAGIEMLFSRLRIPTPELIKLNQVATRELQKAVPLATRLGTDPGEAELLERFAHVGRIEQLAQALGGTIVSSLSLASRNIQAIMLARLRDPTPFDERSLRILTSYLRALRGELDASRNWRNPDLVAIAEAGRRRRL